MSKKAPRSQGNIPPGARQSEAGKGLRRATARILVVDDEADCRWTLSKILTAEGFEVVTAGNGAEAVKQAQKLAPTLILMDMRLPILDGISALKQVKAMAPEIPIIIFTGYGDVPSAVQVMKLGAFDYLTKPFNPDELLMTLQRALEHQALIGRTADLKRRLEDSLGELMGASLPIKKVFRQIHEVAQTNFTVILQGETGTGKEILAQAIHQRSPRREGPFAALDCGAIPETLVESELFGYERGAFTGADRRKAGHFELAKGGTLFLDEIANLPLTTQSKLLRVLQERRVQPLGAKIALGVDVRIVVASNTTLKEEAKAGRFRQDLYYRLNEFTITIPPLRERQEDILYLAKRFLDEASVELKKNVQRFSPEALEGLTSYPWPGNVRELRNVIRQAVLLAKETIEPEHLVAVRSPLLGTPPGMDAGPGLEPGLSLKDAIDRTVAHVEREMIQGALRKTGGNKSRAARLLKLDYKTLHLKMKKYGIVARESTP